ncbi:hypothetical protein [Stenotrophomonas sp. SAU14A_NAIMI4_5]|uniref:hypothetical protein n=1 Tax=Stenotrophomonas sp. SAU14A_NAIMI4_5 TaxID=2072413 RepID=UPI00131F0D5F|nr:hypothetical protein [Stenotrophomonas sp. SAU14A_NAIMI4_5]
MMELDGHQINARVACRALCPLLLASLPLLTACGSKERAPPPYEANPSPKEAYEVVVTTHDAPEDMYASSATVTYAIENEDCLPPIENFEGVRYEPDTHTLEVPIKRTGKREYTGIFFSDGMLEQDYYRRGKCRWSVQTVGAVLKTPASKAYTYFTILTPLVKKEAVTRYALKEIRPWKNDGQVYRSRDWSQEMFDEEVSPLEHEKFFSYSISAGERKPQP